MSFCDSVEHTFTFRAVELSKGQNKAGRKLRWYILLP
jgi:hypothetical protein